MTLRDHLGLRTHENAALHDELDRLLAAKAEGMREAVGMVTLGDTVTRTQARILAAAEKLERP